MLKVTDVGRMQSGVCPTNTNGRKLNESNWIIVYNSNGFQK